MMEASKSKKQEESPYTIMETMRKELLNQLPYNRYHVQVFRFPEDDYYVLSISNNILNVDITSNKNRWKIEVAEFEDVTIDATYLQKVVNSYSQLNKIFGVLTQHVQYQWLHNRFQLKK